MPPRTIAIGDIHGHAEMLGQLLEAVAPSSIDTLVFLGDFINRGPDSLGVLDRIIALGERCRVISLLGNHEQMLLKQRSERPAACDWLSSGSGDDPHSAVTHLSPEELLEEHWTLLDGLRLYFETDTHFFIHANYAPNWRLEEHDSTTALWLPLTEFPGPHYSGKIAILGHTPQPNGDVLTLPHLVCIDTGCGFGGPLTAIDCESGRVWQADDTVSGLRYDTHSCHWDANTPITPTSLPSYQRGT
jgi:serine/threonine protein phosphatase 1